MSEFIYYTSYKDKGGIISSSSVEMSDSHKILVQKQRYGRANKATWFLLVCVKEEERDRLRSHFLHLVDGFYLAER